MGKDEIKEDFVIDHLYNNAIKKITLGEALCALPGDQQMDINYTTEVGGCTALYYSLVFQMPKWKYTLKKLDEWMSVSPTHTQAYELTITQKQKLEGSIKQGLASAAQAVADYELAMHDLRKYREIINYFVKAKKDKDEHVLRSLFIDRVDAFTGENFSMISMTKRWPTIITDFIRFGTLDEKSRKDVEKIKDKLAVSQAEATVLKTKNELFENWKKMFLPEVQKRYARINSLVKARERSIAEYREWLKPYVSRHKMMRDSLEKNPQEAVTSVYMAPGFGNAVASSHIRFLGWKVFNPPEMSKPERTGQISPIDSFSKKWARIIAEHHKVWGKVKDGKFVVEDDEKLEERMEKLFKKAVSSKEMSETALYYRVYDIKVMKFLGKIPGKGELEDITFDIKHRTVSQNVLLLHIIELAAVEEKFNRHINELIGSKEYEDDIRKEIETEMEEKKEPSKPSVLSKTRDGVKSAFSGSKNFLIKITSPFIRPGPYESNLEERLTKMYFLPAGQLYAEVIKFLKWKMGVPGSGPSY